MTSFNERVDELVYCHGLDRDEAEARALAEAQRLEDKARQQEYFRALVSHADEEAA